MRTGKEEKIYSKVGNCFYLKVLKLVNLTSQYGVNFKIITSSLCKRKLQQDQERIIKLTKIRLNLKLITFEIIEKKYLSKKRNVEKDSGLAQFVKRLGKKSQRDWIVCRIYIVCRFIVDIYNMWFEIIHIKNRLH